MNDLIYTKKGEVFADSRLVAEKFNKRHIEVMRKIDKLLEDVSEIKGVNFDTLKFIKQIADYRGQAYEYYEMNREAFSLLVMSFTGKKALEWKGRFNKAFYQMEKMLIQEFSNKQNEEWIGQREQSKLSRREETDIIKQFVDYATAQGSTQAKYYYKHITNATYKCLGLIQFQRPKLRDTLNMMELNQLISAEATARNSLIRYMESGENYKVIYDLVKEDLDRLADLIIMPRMIK